MNHMLVKPSTKGSPHFHPNFPISPNLPQFFLEQLTQYIRPKPPTLSTKSMFFVFLSQNSPRFPTKHQQFTSISPPSPPIFPEFPNSANNVTAKFRQQEILGP